MQDWLLMNENKQEIVALQKRRGDLLVAVVDGKIDREEARVKIREINRQIAKLVAQG